MSDTRKKNFDWRIDTNADGLTPQADALLATVMDLRDELKEIKTALGPLQRLNCPNFLGVPRDIASIRREVAGLRRDRKKKKLRASASPR